MGKSLLRQNIENIIYNKFIFACKDEEEFQRFMNGLNRYLDVYEDKLNEKDIEIISLDVDNYSYREHIDYLRKQLADKEKELNEWKDGTIVCKWTNAENKIKQLEQQLAESKEREKGQKELRQMMSEEKNMNFSRYIEMCVKNEQLEQQLAKSKQEANDWKQRFESSEERFKTFNNNGVTALNLKNDKIEELKQQLAEKDKKQKRTNKVVKQFQQRLKYFSEQDQDKISFAVERLRKAKFDALMLGGLVQGETFFINSEHYRNYIDNQIKQLKGQK